MCRCRSCLGDAAAVSVTVWDVTFTPSWGTAQTVTVEGVAETMRPTRPSGDGDSVVDRCWLRGVAGECG